MPFNGPLSPNLALGPLGLQQKSPTRDSVIILRGEGMVLWYCTPWKSADV